MLDGEVDFGEDGVEADFDDLGDLHVEADAGVVALFEFDGVVLVVGPGADVVHVDGDLAHHLLVGLELDAEEGFAELVFCHRKTESLIKRPLN